MRCLVASVRSRAAINLVDTLQKIAPEHSWELIEDLGDELPDAEIIFFFRWPKIVPDSSISKSTAKLVVFHTSDLPRGRGGSPIQNQIADGTYITRVNAIEMKGSVDSGAVYASQDITLQGTADDIWMSISHAACRLAIKVVEGVTPSPQSGDPTFFKRRKDNSLPQEADTLHSVHRFVQMLDGEGYPGAHIDYGNMRITFTRSSDRGDHVLCDARITLRA